MLRKTPVQLAAIIAAALILAVVANGFASRQRRLVLPGYYPHALRVPPRAPDKPATSDIPATTATQPAVTTDTTMTTLQSPAPGQPAIAIPTATIERPAGIAGAAATPAAPAAATPPASVPAAKSSPAAAAPAQPAEADPLARFTPHPDKAYVEISGSDAALLHSRGALFLDARRSSVYEEGHIAGSRSFSVWESDIDEKVNALFSERSDPREQNLPIVIYCTGGACEDSHMLAEKLWGVQFNNVYVYKDGFPDWQKRGGAVKAGTQP